MAFNTGGAMSGAMGGAMTGAMFGPPGMAIGAALGGIGGGLMGGGDDTSFSELLAKQMYKNARRLAGTYQDYYEPLVERLPGMANIPLTRYTNQAAANVAGAYDRNRGMAQRGMARIGVNPNSGRWQGLQAHMDRSEAAARSDAMTRARTQGQMENFQRSASVGQIGLGMMGQSMSGMNAAGGLMNQAGALSLQQQQQAYGQQNDMAGAIGQLLGSVLGSGQTMTPPVGTPLGGGWVAGGGPQFTPGIGF